jgi:IS30 family transposase
MSHTHLSRQERYVISHLSVAGFSRREIARRINRHHTTVSRELRRNGPQQLAPSEKETSKAETLWLRTSFFLLSQKHH